MRLFRVLIHRTTATDHCFLNWMMRILFQSNYQNYLSNNNSIGNIQQHWNKLGSYHDFCFSTIVSFVKERKNKSSYYLQYWTINERTNTPHYETISIDSNNNNNNNNKNNFSSNNMSVSCTNDVIWGEHDKNS